MQLKNEAEVFVVWVFSNTKTFTRDQVKAGWH